MSLSAEDVADKGIDVLDFSEETPLEHPKSFGGVKNLKSGDSPESLHGLIPTVVDAAVRILIKDIENGDK